MCLGSLPTNSVSFNSLFVCSRLLAIYSNDCSVFPQVTISACITRIPTHLQRRACLMRLQQAEPPSIMEITTISWPQVCDDTVFVFFAVELCCFFVFQLIRFLCSLLSSMQKVLLLSITLEPITRRKSVSFPPPIFSPCPFQRWSFTPNCTRWTSLRFR